MKPAYEFDAVVWYQPAVYGGRMRVLTIYSNKYKPLEIYVPVDMPDNALESLVNKINAPEECKMNKHKDFAIKALKSYRADNLYNLYKVRAAFSGMTDAQMKEQYEKSGKTRAERLAGYEEQSTDIDAAIDWLNSLPDENQTSADLAACQEGPLVLRKGYCSDCGNNQDIPLPGAAKLTGNPCNGCWTSLEKPNWKPKYGTHNSEPDKE